MEGEDQRFFRSRVADGDRFADRKTLDEDARPHEFEQFALADLCDAKATLLFAQDPTIGMEAAEGFADRAETNAVAVAEEIELQLLAGRVTALDDVEADLLVHRAGKRQSGCLVPDHDLPTPRFGAALGAPLLSKISSTIRYYRQAIDFGVPFERMGWCVNGPAAGVSQ